jgi:hypothetical protein
VEENQEAGLEQAAALELAKLLTAVGSKSDLRDTFVSDPVEAAERCDYVDSARMGSVLERLVEYTPEQRSFLLELNETWPLRLEVNVDEIAKLQMPF